MDTIHYMAAFHSNDKPLISNKSYFDVNKMIKLFRIRLKTQTGNNLKLESQRKVKIFLIF